MIFLLVIGGVVLVAQKAGSKEAKESDLESLGVPQAVVEKAEKVGEEVLGVASKVLPIEKKLTGTDTKTLIEQQTDQILESIRKLPEQEAKKIKKELLLDFCQQALED